MNYKFLKHHKQKESKTTLFFKNFSQIQLTKKQKFALGMVLLSFIYVNVTAQGAIVSSSPHKDIGGIINGIGTGTGKITAIPSFMSMFGWVDIIKNAIQYIVSAQMKSTSAIAGTSFGNTGMFNFITGGLTIFAVIACAYKIVTHYLNTERYDNVKSFTGFFSYFGVLLLFIFSNTIVDRVVSLNQSINTSAISSIGTKLDQELDNEIAKDYKLLETRVGALNDEYEKLGITDIGKIFANRIEYVWSQFGDFYLGNIVKYTYFSFFALLLTAVLAIPTFIMTLMVKVLLSVMVAGTKLVFILAFIPGFENTWKTFMLNLINILLWVPIFNALIAFILSICSSIMISGSMTSGQIIWLSIVAIVCAYQAITLTTTSANAVINGAGAGLAGAMGGMAGMNAMSVVGGAIGGATAVGVMGASSVATGGTSAVASASASKFSK